MVSREWIFRIPCQLISVRLFFFVCMLLNIMHLFGMKNAFFKVGTIYSWVCRELMFKSGSMMAVVAYFSKFFTFLRRRIDLCASDIQNAIKNISTFILIQWVRLLVYSMIWIMPCIFWNGTVSSTSARERICAYILVMLAHEQTFVGIKMHSNHAVVLIGMRKWNLD